MLKFAFAAALALVPALAFADTTTAPSVDSKEISAPAKPADPSAPNAQGGFWHRQRAWRFSGFILGNFASQMKASDATVTSSTGAKMSGAAQMALDPAVGFGAEARWRRPTSHFGFSAGASYDVPRRVTNLSFSSGGASATGDLSGERIELTTVFINTNFYLGKAYLFGGLNATNVSVTESGAGTLINPGLGGQAGVGYEFTHLISFEAMYRYSTFQLDQYGSGAEDFNFHRVVIQGAQAQLKFSI